MTVINHAKKAPLMSFLFSRVGDLRTWELCVAQSLFMFLMGFLFQAVSKMIPAVLGEGQAAEVARDAVGLTKAVTFTGKYTDAPKELQIV